jgi:hypothetical protein
MVTILTYGEVITEIVGLSLILISFLFCIRLLAKTAGKLKKAIIYFLIGSIPGGLYFGARLINIEVLLPEGKLIDLVLASIVSFFVLMGLFELNKIVNELFNKTECKPKKEIKFETPKPEKKPAQTFTATINNKYLDLTGRKPKFRA